ncbi:MAG: serine/threonine-protein phosphatase, partial [Firmicutes bacterium]|nr:serine/threonine-protein phosphatase [Bacillota bacterium]
ALVGCIVASSGLLFQYWQLESAAVAVYLLRIGLGVFAAWVFGAAMERRDPVVDWMVSGLSVLALAQVAPVPYLGLGYIAVGTLTMAGAFPAAALGGLALDLAQVTAVPMAAVASLAYLLRLIPGIPERSRYFAPPVCYLLVMLLCGVWDMAPLPGLVIGGALAMLVPGRPGLSRRRGETGVAQVRLEMASTVMGQARHLLAQVEDAPIDEQALIARAAERACSSCPCRKSCKEKPAQMPTTLLHRPLGNGADLPSACRKSGRLLQELRRSQEQLRLIRADRDRQMEYRAAVVQQYQFLSEYLQDVSDSLAQRAQPTRQWFQPEVAACTAGMERENGDRCVWFAGVECRYYLLLCDGMGTGAEAAREAQTACGMLRKLLSVGYPAQYALRWVNSLCALRGCAGAVTVDLAELRLDTGRVTLYKWGAAPSYLISGGDMIKVGTATPPPGLSVTDGRETVERLSLRKGETLVLLSDGAGGEEALRKAWNAAFSSPGELAERILQSSQADGSDDATVAVARLFAAAVPPS